MAQRSTGKEPNSVATGGALMRERFIGTAPGKESGLREAKGLFVVESECSESECSQFLRTVPVLPRDAHELTGKRARATGPS
jgi:hypothetical protein